MAACPPRNVLDAFRAAGPLRRLAGGQGTSFRAGDVILKPVDDPHVADWIASLFHRLSGPGFQVSRPVRSCGGEWIVEGWSAWNRFGGRHVTGRWADRMTACAMFHRALAGEPRPDFVGRLADPWSIADRMAWGEIAIESLPVTRPFIHRLLARLEPSHATNQLIHGDVAGNFLFAAGEPPCIIDFSPYWRPAEFALAVLVVDAITWSNANPAMLSASGVSRAMLARAALRRILEHDLHHRLRGRPTLGDLPYYERLFGLLGW